jgi:Cu+-exporting ATPase
MHSIDLLLSSRAGMDLLVVIGTSAAYFYSLLILAMQYLSSIYLTSSSPSSSSAPPNMSDMVSSSYHGHDFFETSAVLISTVCLGKYLEHVAKAHTTAALQSLVQLQARRSDLLLITPASLHQWLSNAKQAAKLAIEMADQEKSLSKLSQFEGNL